MLGQALRSLGSAIFPENDEGSYSKGCLLNSRRAVREAPKAVEGSLESPEESSTKQGAMRAEPTGGAQA